MHILHILDLILGVCRVVEWLERR